MRFAPCLHAPLLPIDIFLWLPPQLFLNLPEASYTRYSFCSGFLSDFVFRLSPAIASYASCSWLVFQGCPRYLHAYAFVPDTAELLCFLKEKRESASHPHPHR